MTLGENGALEVETPPVAQRRYFMTGIFSMEGIYQVVPEIGDGEN